jgi:hypothetical protein
MSKSAMSQRSGAYCKGQMAVAGANTKTSRGKLKYKKAGSIARDPA